MERGFGLVKRSQFMLGGSMLRIGEARRAGHIGGVLIALVLGADALALYLNVDRMWGFDARGSGQVGSCNLD